MDRVAPGPSGDLPDINVWIALLNAQHPHHSAAKLYWENTEATRVGFCRVTMLGVLRLSTNKVVMGGAPYTTQEAWEAFQAVAALPEVKFIAEPAGIDVLMQQLTAAPSFRSTDWTDAYLAALAQLSNLRMVSFDKGFANYGGLTLLAVLLLLGISRAALWFIPIWLVCAAINMWVGVSSAGYSVAAELPIFVLVFAVPAAIALMVRWKLG